MRAAVIEYEMPLRPQFAGPWTLMLSPPPYEFLRPMWIRPCESGIEGLHVWKCGPEVPHE